MTYGGFHEFLQKRIKDKGLDPSRLSRLSGISLRHIKGLVGEDVSLLPPAPYIYGYLRRLGELLEFDGEVWWQRIKGAVREETVRVGSLRPKGARLFRSLKTAGAVLAIFVFSYLLIRSPHVLGKPVVSVEGMSGSPVFTTERTFTIRGTLKNGDELTINGEWVEFASDGSWQKTVLLAEGLNSIEVRARKFLGKEAAFTGHVVYSPEKILEEVSSNTQPNS